MTFLRLNRLLLAILFLLAAAPRSAFAAPHNAAESEAPEISISDETEPLDIEPSVVFNARIQDLLEQLRQTYALLVNPNLGHQMKAEQLDGVAEQLKLICGEQCPHWHAHLGSLRKFLSQEGPSFLDGIPATLGLPAEHQQMATAGIKIIKGLAIRLLENSTPEQMAYRLTLAIDWLRQLVRIEEGFLFDYVSLEGDGKQQALGHLKRDAKLLFLQGKALFDLAMIFKGVYEVETLPDPKDPSKTTSKIHFRQERLAAQMPEVMASVRELGIFYAKLIQSVSNLGMALGEDVVKFLKPFQENFGEAMEPALVRSIFREELGATPESLFIEFDYVPFALGTLAQVHHAMVLLPDGRRVRVAVKVKRPGGNGQLLFSRDVTLMLVQTMRVMGASETKSELLEFLDDQVIGLNDEFRRELDFMREARFMNALRLRYALSRHVQIPKPYFKVAGRAYTSAGIITMEEMQGEKFEDAVFEVKGGRRRQKDLARIYANLQETLIDQALVFGEMHADLHPGNLQTSRRGAFPIQLFDFGHTVRTSGMLWKPVKLLIAAKLKSASFAASALMGMQANSSKATKEQLMATADEVFSDKADDFPILPLLFAAMKNNHYMITPKYLEILRSVLPELAMHSQVSSTLDEEPAQRLLSNRFWWSVAKLPFKFVFHKVMNLFYPLPDIAPLPESDRCKEALQ